jgi:hypothetical protein
MLRAFLIELASSRGPYDDSPTVTQGIAVYNLPALAGALPSPLGEWHALGIYLGDVETIMSPFS